MFLFYHHWESIVTIPVLLYITLQQKFFSNLYLLLERHEVMKAKIRIQQLAAYGQDNVAVAAENRYESLT